MSEREQAAAQCAAILDEKFFKALSEPARLAVFREVVLIGPADIGQIAERLPQDRSVISRHLQVLADAGIVVADKQGRHVHYQVDGPEMIRRLEEILGVVRLLQPICCPAGEAVQRPRPRR